MNELNCVFCQMVAGEAICHKVWEDSGYLAFLSIYPNTEGFTVVIPKEHFGSYIADAPIAVRAGLMEAALTVARILDAKLPEVGRTGIVFEGFGVNHLHAKLFPMHGTKGDWKPRTSNVDKYFDTYEGYISSHGGKRVDDDVLAALAAKLRS